MAATAFYKRHKKREARRSLALELAEALRLDSNLRHFALGHGHSSLDKSPASPESIHPKSLLGLEPVQMQAEVQAEVQADVEAEVEAEIWVRR